MAESRRTTRYLLIYVKKTLKPLLRGVGRVVQLYHPLNLENRLRVVQHYKARTPQPLRRPPNLSQNLASVARETRPRLPARRKTQTMTRSVKFFGHLCIILKIFSSSRMLRLNQRNVVNGHGSLDNRQAPRCPHQRSQRMSLLFLTQPLTSAGN